MASENRSLLDMLQGGSQAGQQHQPQGQPSAPPQQGPPGLQQQQQQQHPFQFQQHPQQGMGDMSTPPMPPHPFYQNMGPPPPPIGQMMPGFGFNQQGLDHQHQMFMHQMMQQHGQPRGAPMAQFQSGPPPPQSRAPPQGNALASLLQSLNQPASVSPTNTSTSTFMGPSQSQQQQQPQQQQQQQQQPHSQTQSQAHTPTSQADLQASTESLKLALFGPPSAQQKTEDLKMALFGSARPDLTQAQPQPSPKKEEVNLLAMLQMSAGSPSPSQGPSADIKSHDGESDIKPTDLRREPTAKSPISKESTPQSSTKSKFTYVNPFHSFSSASAAVAASAPTASTPTPNPTTTPPSHSRTGTPITEAFPSGPPSKRSSLSTPTPRRDTSAHVEPETASRPHDRDQKRYQLDQLLPPHSAWNHRVQKLAKGSSSFPDGVYLRHQGQGPTTYDTGLDNLNAIFSEDLETIPITLIPTDVDYNHGKMVAVSKGYISYAAKGGKIRVIQQSHGHRTLLRGHTDQVIDMSFSSADQGASGSQLLASVGKDSRVIIWDLSTSHPDSTDIDHSKYLELIGAPQSDQPRYNRIAWSPRNASQLALVNNDDHSVLIVDIHSLIGSQLNDSPTVTETQLRAHSLVIQAHDQAINDLSFSRDGTALVTASEDGTVKFWDLHAAAGPALLNEFVPHGGLGVTNAIFVDHPDATASRCVVTACRRGTELSLWHVAGSGPLDQFVFKEPPSSIRRSSLGKSASRSQDMRMFNFMGYDHETSSLVLANSARLSLFGLKIKVTPASEADRPTGVSQAAYIKSALTLDATSCAATFDFMIEYPMPQPVVSFIVMPDSSLEYNGFSVYCIQAKAVQQYIIKGLEPHDKSKCQIFESVSPVAKVTEPKIARTNSKNNTPKASNSPSIKDTDTADASILLKSDATTGVATEGLEGKEPEKPIKLHGPVINGAIAKLKEKKRNSSNDSQNGTDGADKKESPKLPTSGRMGRKTSQDMSLTTPPSEAKKPASTPVALGETKNSADAKNSGRNNTRNQANRTQDTTDGASPVPEQGSSLVSGDNISITLGDLQTMLLAMEDKIASRFEKKLNAELELQYRKMDQDQIARQEAVLKLVSQTLAKNTEQLLVQTVNKEIQNSVIPSLNKVIGAAVERQIARTMGDAAAKTLPSAIETAVSENVERVMSGSDFRTNLTAQVATTIRPSIEDSFKESFTKVLIPSYQKATQAMFQQIHSAFQSGIEDLTAANQKDHESIEALNTNIKKVASNVEGIQASLAQAQHAQSEAPLGGGPGRLDSQRRSVASGLQRTLQGEDYSGTSNYGSRRTSQQTSPTESKQTSAINQLIAYGDFEGAFTQALSTNEPSAVFHICSKVSPRTVFQQTSSNPNGTLSQPVLLALTHHLANDQQLGQNLGIRLSWLQEILMRLNPKDPLLGDHMARILPTVQARLEATYSEVANSGEANPHLHTLQLLLRYVHSMQL
ncbi:hypothetical protein BG015_000256 [Linnemannia schmuckeri]|uniref:Enhancer of mRNA-decapping protein 4 WD40 repeat region domain-containing protein n=1 Tax=Linnemannia schmuckeri TaxID=64567 RepID=A0A9P5RRA8_9FUNG|nr:hypothetical protein BG015_000256 [Linnemannia schmuckeri]